MRARLRPPDRLAPLLFALTTVALVTADAALLPFSGDYQLHGAPGADNAGPPLLALLHANFSQLLAVQPVMGLVSLLWRAPFVGVAMLCGADNRLNYAVGSGACALPLGGLAWWLAARVSSRRELLAVAVAVATLAVGPATPYALLEGHPEELLTAGLVTAAVLAGRADRRVWAGVLLGLAIGAKEWAVFTAPAVILALPAGRRRAALIATALAAITTAPLPLLDPTAFRHADASIGAVSDVRPWSVWWPISYFTGRPLPFGMKRPEAAVAGLAAGAAIAWLYGRWRARAEDARPRLDTLALLALLGLLRCLTDPSDLGYYLVAAIVPLAVWETHVLRRVPIVTLLACLIQVPTIAGPYPFSTATPPPSDGVLATNLRMAEFMLAALALAAYLIVQMFKDHERVLNTSASATALATPALSDSRPGLPPGILTSASQISRVRRRSPSPSAPTTSTVRSSNAVSASVAGPRSSSP